MLNDSVALASALGKVLLQRQLKCAVAESCTGGLLAAAITHIAGCSDWFDRGFITYTNQAKIEMLGVSSDILFSDGAVSAATASAMAKGVLLHSHANVSMAITGIAGPGGGSIKKPVGTVWIAWAFGLQSIKTQCYSFKGDREDVRQQAVCTALDGVLQYMLNKE